MVCRLFGVMLLPAWKLLSDDYNIDLDSPLRWRHNGRDSDSNHQPHHCLLNRYSDADQRKHQSSASLAFVWGIHRGSVNSPHKWPVTRKMFPFDDVIMECAKSHPSVSLRLWELTTCNVWTSSISTSIPFSKTIKRLCIKYPKASNQRDYILRIFRSLWWRHAYSQAVMCLVLWFSWKISWSQNMSN